MNPLSPEEAYERGFEDGITAYACRNVRDNTPGSASQDALNMELRRSQERREGGGE